VKTLMWLGLGAAAMYYLDPEQGRRRRAQAREQVSRARRTIRERAQGLPRGQSVPESAHHLGR
jgi:hypothetical protein